jgi:hypothetical protein
MSVDKNLSKRIKNIEESRHILYSSYCTYSCYFCQPALTTNVLYLRNMALYFLNPSNKWNTSLLPFETPWTTPSVENAPMEYKKEKRSVKFEDFCRVILIPTREEYVKANIKLWWSPNEFNVFKTVRMMFMLTTFPNRM